MRRARPRGLGRGRRQRAARVQRRLPGQYGAGVLAVTSAGARITDNVIQGIAGGDGIAFSPNAQFSVASHNLIVANLGGVYFGGNPKTASRRNVAEQNVITRASRFDVHSGYAPNGPPPIGNAVRKSCLWSPAAVTASGPGFRMSLNRSVRPRVVKVRASTASRLPVRVGVRPPAVVFRGMSGRLADAAVAAILLVLAVGADMVAVAVGPSAVEAGRALLPVADGGGPRARPCGGPAQGLRRPPGRSAARHGGRPAESKRRVTSPEWVSYSSQFYRRRWVVPAAAAGLAPLVGDRALPSVSLAAYALSGLLVFLLLRLRFDRRVSFGVVALVLVLPASPLLVGATAQRQRRRGRAHCRTHRRRAGARPRPPLAAALGARRGDPRLHPRRLVDSRRLDSVGRAALPGPARRSGSPSRGCSPQCLRSSPSARRCGMRWPTRWEGSTSRGTLPGAPLPTAIRPSSRVSSGATSTTSPRTRSRSSSSCSRSPGSRSGRARRDPYVTLARAALVCAAPYVAVVPNYTAMRLELVFVPSLAVGPRLFPRRGGDEAPPSGARVCNRQLFVRLAAPGRWCG